MGSTTDSYPLKSDGTDGLSSLNDFTGTSESLRNNYGLNSTFTSANLLGLSDSAPPIWTAGNNATRTSTTGGTVTARVKLLSTGAIDLVNGTDGSWLPSGASAGDYEAKWVHVGGAVPNGTWAENQWNVLSTNREVSLTVNEGSTLESDVDIYIREKATGAQIIEGCLLYASSSGGGEIEL